MADRGGTQAAAEGGGGTAQARLRAIRDSGLVEAEALPSLDRVVAAATRLLRAPVALLCVFTEDRQVPLAWRGHDRWGEVIPLEQSPASSLLQQESSVALEDAASIPRYRQFFARRGATAFVAVPLESPRVGPPLGALCLADFHPRDAAGA
jgi:hypothetical protein